MKGTELVSKIKGTEKRIIDAGGFHEIRWIGNNTDTPKYPVRVFKQGQRISDMTQESAAEFIDRRIEKGFSDETDFSIKF